MQDLSDFKISYCPVPPHLFLQPNHYGSRMVTGVTEADADLVSSALSGSERAFQQLVRRYERPVFSVILRVVRDPSRAEELAQDAFVKAFRRLGTYRPECRFSTWLLAIAHHVAIDEVRKGSLRTTPLEEAPTEYLSKKCDGDNPYDVTERKELALILDEAIRRLRPEYAELITLRYEQDLTIEDIAEITGLAIGTIKSSLHRARKDLADSLRRRGLGTTP
jgi:RNA polymerase sigma-70 factor (ECF subfamily)